MIAEENDQQHQCMKMNVSERNGRPSTSVYQSTASPIGACRPDSNRPCLVRDYLLEVIDSTVEKLEKMGSEIRLLRIPQAVVYCYTV